MPENFDSCRGRSTAGILAVALAVLALAGCATNPILDTGPGPDVADCALIKQATPTLYVCNGKTYTATQLYDIRHGYQPSVGLPPNAPRY
jgi:hypothetical protein